MDINREKLDDLTRRINELAKQQSLLSKELVQLINELELVKKQVAGTAVSRQPAVTHQPKVIEHQQVIEAPVHKPVPQPQVTANKSAPKKTATFEEFVGKSLASKIGILVTIAGVFIGAKYAIEHDLISPALRIITGYLCGGVLMAIAIRLKKKYEGYSAVLMGGGIAVLYFITYTAYSFYHLLPQLAAFGLMLVFTIVSVYAALIYNQVIIAHLGLVGAYAIPFLLSNNSGRYEILFSYIAIINMGILVISLRKYWKSLFYAAYIATWIIYSVWMALTYYKSHPFDVAATFLCIFFLTFYATFLAYKLVKKEQYNFGDVTVLLSNAFLFYGFGYGLLSWADGTENYTGLFAVANALIHLTISQVIRKLKLADRTLYYFILGLVIVFLTIAIPVQLDGNWVTLLWTAEAVLVFIIGQTRKAPAYLKLGTGLALLSFFSLLQDWFMYYVYYPDNNYNFIVNNTFLTGLIVVLAQGTIIYFNRTKKYAIENKPVTFFTVFYDYVVPVLLLITGYFIFQLELKDYFNRLYKHVNSADGSFGVWGDEVSTFALVIYLLYAMLFVTVIAIVNHRRLNNKQLGTATTIGTFFLLFLLLIQGLPVLHHLTSNYFLKDGNGLYFGKWNLLVRYIVIASAVLLLYLGQRTIKFISKEPTLNNSWWLLIHVVILGLLTSEYLHWATFGGADNQFKLGLSILWGLYALFMVITGIRKKKKYLRLAAIVLFCIILIKLFVYDLSEAGTITKTISFISLGVILLLVSYLYNRYKEILFGEEER